jgi:NAD(P)-dependent dehydrogenase (short-subunit alcohol dehydrogenase family)
MTQRIAVVTGANRGLGLATCRELARRGQRVVLTARDAGQAQSAAAQLRAEGLDVTAATLDVSSDASVEAFARRIEKELGRLDVLVNNAGAIFEQKGSRATTEVSPEILARTFDTNTLGAYRLTRLFLPQMNRAGYGRVVNVSSGMGGITEMGGGSPAYRVSKAALNALTRIFHAEAGKNVKVNSVCPGWVRTDMGGAGATRNLEQGIAGIVWAATLPDIGPSGGFFRDGQPIAF